MRCPLRSIGSKTVKTAVKLRVIEKLEKERLSGVSLATLSRVCIAKISEACPLVPEVDITSNRSTDFTDQRGLSEQFKSSHFPYDLIFRTMQNGEDGSVSRL